MNYTLIGSQTSPYVRKLRLFLHAIAPFELKAINYLEKNDSDYLKSINPINKIPLLIDGDKVIYDSRVIFNYLAKQHQFKPLTLKEENYLSAIDAGLGTSINLFSLKRGGLDLDSGNSYIQRQKERIPLILKYISPYAENLNASTPEDWNFVSMSLYSYLDWGLFRGVIDLSDFPALNDFVNRFKNAPGVVETRPL